MVKKVLVCFMLIFVTLFGFGCGSINYSVKFADGAIVQEIVVDIDIEDMNLSQSTALRNKVIDVMVGFNLNMETYWRERRAEWEESGVEDLQEYQLLYALYTGDTEMYIENGKLKMTKAFGSIYSYLFYNYPDLFVYDTESQTLKLDKSFLADVPLDSELSQIDETFLTKYIQECLPLNYNGGVPTFTYDIYKANWSYYAGEESQWSPSYQIDINATGNKLKTSIDLSPKPLEAQLIIEKGTTLEAAIKACFTNGESYEFEDAKVTYEYKTPYRRVHSNAEKIEKKDNYYVHTWDLTSFADTITISRAYANPVIWYVVAIGATLVVIAVLTAVGIYIKNKNKPKDEIVIDDRGKEDKPKDDKPQKEKKEKLKKEPKKKKGKKQEKNENWIDRIYD